VLVNIYSIFKTISGKEFLLLIRSMNKVKTVWNNGRSENSYGIYTSC